MKNERIDYIDFLRVMAMFAVVVNHTMGCYCVGACGGGGVEFVIDLVLYSLSRFNVPIFVMISGALNLTDARNKDIYYVAKMRIRKVIIPLITWTFIYCIIYSIFGGRNLISELFCSILYPRSYANHLWYIYMCILLYLVTPILIQIVQGGNKMIDLVIGLWIIFSLVYPLLNFVLPSVELRDYQNYNLAGGYVGYYILGYRLHHKSTQLKNKYIFGFVFIISWGVIFFCCCNLVDYINLFVKFNSPMIAVMSASLFLLVKDSTKIQRFTNKYYSKILILSKLSFGVYFIHYFVADGFKILVKNGYIRPTIYFTFGSVLVFGISIVLIMMVYKAKKLSFLLMGI